MKYFLPTVFLALFLVSCGAKQPAILSSSTNPTETATAHEPFLDVTEMAPNKKSFQTNVGILHLWQGLMGKNLSFTVGAVAVRMKVKTG